MSTVDSQNKPMSYDASIARLQFYKENSFKLRKKLILAEEMIERLQTDLKIVSQEKELAIQQLKEDRQESEFRDLNHKEVEIETGFLTYGFIYDYSNIVFRERLISIIQYNIIFELDIFINSVLLNFWESSFLRRM
ncbi:hypothetical protein J7E79_15545 [Bacillus sp. ISL-40]|uniref:hypothetical protein n=1 Tax=Bacillus sp. ISL-40 TaxID=2819126 RepID=UPI001BE9D888|nr:hypothetical protein [Bacillus sp. ISL-40]MBT2698815.1 hypothetical protein [Bacillus sp. ISL-40]